MLALVNTLAAYTQHIDLYCKQFRNNSETTGLWFRGQEQTSWDLRPKIYRPDCPGKFEREITRDFRQNTATYLDAQSRHGIDLLFTMQHYSAPTRLLDWSESYLIALYFAVESHARNTTDGRVWILRPRALNRKTCNIDTVPMPLEFNFDSYLLDTSPPNLRDISATAPIAIKANRNNVRIIAQQGQFTIHGSDPTALNNLTNHTDYLDYIDIDGTAKKDIYTSLVQAGISRSRVFPELEYIAQDITEKYTLMDKRSHLSS